MGRYGKTRSPRSGRSRYASTDEKIPNRAKKAGPNRLVIGVLAIAALAAGLFFVKPEGRVWDTDALVALWFAKFQVPKTETAEGRPAAGRVEQSSTAEKLGLTEIVVSDERILPELDGSDEAVRDALVTLTPGIAPYLKTGQIIRRYMQIANDFSQGIRVARHFYFLRLPEPFSVQDEGQQWVISENSYLRYANLAQAIDSINAAEWLELYIKFRPLMLQVFAEFSYPAGHNLDDMVIGAARQILSAPVISQPVVVVRQSGVYKYEDLKLEAMNSVHKQMVRMGPVNTRLIQKKISELMSELVNPRVVKYPGQVH